MENAHVDAVMILGQVFDNNREYYDFGDQDVTKRYVCSISVSISEYIIIIHMLQDPRLSANYNKS